MKNYRISKLIKQAASLAAAAALLPVFAHGGEREAMTARLTVPRAWELNRIVVDGDLRDRPWEQATMTYGFVVPDGGAAAEPATRTRVIHDYHGVYLGFTAMGAEGAASDEVGVNLSWPDAEGNWRRVVISLSRDAGLAFNSDAQEALHIESIQAAVRAGEGLWDAEIFIPYESLGVGMPAFGDLWKANFFRRISTAGVETPVLSGWLPEGQSAELRFGRDLLVYLYSKRPFYAPDEIMVFNYSDRLRRLVGEYVNADGETVQQMPIHLGPGHRRQHYRMEGVPKGMHWVVVRDRDAMLRDDNVIMVMPRPQLGN